MTRWPVTLALVLLAIVALRLFLSHWIPSPYIITDELLYTKLARSLATDHTTHFRGAAMNFPAVLYPLLLVPAYLAQTPELSFRLAQVTNALLMTAAGVPFALLARRLVGERAALPLTLVVMLAPYTLYANVAMSENAFFPLVLAIAYLTLRSLDDARSWPKLALGLCLGLAFFAKPHGLLLPVAVATASLVGVVSARPTLRGALSRLAAYWPALVVYLGFLALHVVKTNWLLGSPSWFDLSGFFGSYAGGFSSVHAFSLPLFLRSAAANLGAIAVSLAVAPVVLYGVFLYQAVRRGTWQDRAFAAFGLTLSVLLIAVTARHTVTLDDPSRIHERYCFHVAPLMLVGAMRALALMRVRSRAWLVPILALVALIPWFAGLAAATPYVADSPSMTLLSGLIERLGARTGTLVAVPFILVSAVGIGWALLARRWQAAAVLGIGYVLVLTSASAYAQRHSSRSHADSLPLVRWVTEHVPPTTALALVATEEQFKNCLVIEFYTRHPNYLYYFGPHPIHGANDRSVERTPDGELAGLSRLPDGTRVMVPTAYPLAQPVVATYQGLVLYEKRGRVLLRDSSPDGRGDARAVGRRDGRSLDPNPNDLAHSE